LKYVNVPAKKHFVTTADCKQRLVDIYHHKFEKWYRNAVVTKQPSEHYYLSHATFPFPPNRFLCPAVVYSIFLAFCVNLWLLCTYCVAIPFLKLMMVTSADCCLHATRKCDQRTNEIRESVSIKCCNRISPSSSSFLEAGSTEKLGSSEDPLLKT
jgi:hypothetical protein